MIAASASKTVRMDGVSMPEGRRSSRVLYKVGEETFELPGLFVDCLDHGNKINGSIDLSRPFRIDGYLWATNMHVTARIHLAMLPARFAEIFDVGHPWGRSLKYKRSMLEVWDHSIGASQARDPLSLPAIPAGAELMACDYYSCKAGTVTCSYGHPHRCPNCEGTGRIRSTQPVAVGLMTLSACYVHMLIQGGIDTVYVPRTLVPNGGGGRTRNCVYFRDGILEGLIAANDADEGSGDEDDE